MTLAEEQRRIKQDFKKVAEDSNSGDDLLVKKPRRHDSDSDEPLEEAPEDNKHLVTD